MILSSTTIRQILKMVALLLIDCIVIWFWVRQMDPDPSASIGIFLLIPIVIIVNLLAGAVLLLFKNANAKLFFINSIAASFIVSELFDNGIRNHQNRIYESWEFSKNDTLFKIERNKEYNEFSISYSMDNGSSTEFMTGRCIAKNDSVVLKSDSGELYIFKYKLHNFRKSVYPIAVKMIDF